ncbi:MAG TPA: M14 family metallopeptidase, partial [Planctomycetota bacterium]|nr:M14 family metallopeptidase [Planctomycetota bacterium]
MLPSSRCAVLGAFAAFAAVAFVRHAPAQVPAQPVRQLVEVVVTGPAQMQQLLAMDLDLAACRLPLPAQRRIEVITYPGDLARLQQAGFDCRVLVDDLVRAHAAAVAQFPVAEPDALNPPIGQGAMGGHYTLQQMEAILDSFSLQYPQLCAQKVSIGLSLEGRDMWMVKISDNVGVDESEPEVYYDAVHHAREPLSMSTTLLFMDELLAGYGTDPEATFLINERELFFVPCVNPDGYEYNRLTNPNGGGMWRKNRRNNGGGIYGVDLNRNYATGWSAPFGGSSTSPSSDTYRGTAPFSEPETQVIEAFAASRQFVTTFSSHTYQDVLLRPWAYQTTDPGNVVAYQNLGAQWVQENGVAHGRGSTLLYIASGTAIDHHHAARGSYSWTAELGRSNEGGFWPVGPTIEVIARRHQPMFRKVALTAGPAFRLDAMTVTEGPGSNGNAMIDPGETGLVVATVQNLGVAAAPLTLDLIAVDPQLTIGTGSIPVGSVAALSSLQNAQPLSFTVPVSFASPVARLLVRVSGDSRTTDYALDVPLVIRRVSVDDDFEVNRGFARGTNTASTGLWERSTPQATTAQPGSQTTPGGTMCWVTDGRAGTSAGTYDVDNGYTHLLSPEMDLSHLASATVSFDLWYAESLADDPLLVQLSRDGGGSWSLLYQRSTPTGAWTRIELPLLAPLTEHMVLRVRAQDQFASTVEALVDGFEVRAVAADGAVTLLGSGVLGTVLRLGMNGPDPSLVLPL